MKYRLFITFGLNVSVGLLDGFGLVMFLPLLKLADNEGSTTSEDMGKLDFILKGMEAIGLGLNLPHVLMVMFIFFVLKGIARFIESYYKTIVQNFFIKSLRFKTIDGLAHLSYKAFVTQDSGTIQNTLSGEVGRVVGAYNSYFTAVQCGIMVFVYSTLAFLANAQFALLVIVGGMSSNWIFNIINKKTKVASHKITREGHLYQGLLIQKVGFFKYLKATGLVHPFADKLKQSVENIEKSNKAIGFYGAILYASKEPLIIGVVVIVILVQTTFFAQNMGLILLSLMFFYRALTFLMSFQGFWNTFLTSSGALSNILEFLKSLRRHKEKCGKMKLERFQEKIRLEGVNFRYGTVPVLQDIDLSIRKNETIAFVGESGSGKTTLVNILAGLIAVDHGKFTIDGISSKDLDLRVWQNRIGYITQEPVIFSDTVYHNVTFWAPKTPENINRFWKALEKASIADFVRGLERQEEAPLGSNGILVSGGQKQRISIARELYKDIDVLIMDEATSSLDSETEKIIKENIVQLKGQYTILIVAHRLATVKHADRIVLLSNGCIKAIDSFNQLVEVSPEFRRMVVLQEF
ncbi:ABC transporter ATP-binding protein [Algoriphagus halophytocola]|uniref:ABC transporter ATP-binding protein/permease n=1 Tax=Algoriphagus halophytocola TaxID=2991499 RepID=A0ABY6MJJ3_9BACT|nr:ABC transporter ATP-binding protein [Algoriphagus sp. TR-M5]UZD23940.1 ABC transporter ATP-binding protein/permease [Algoriphagus sp. TR-M5]